MTRRTGDPLLQLVKSFFSEHLRVRGVSRNTQDHSEAEANDTPCHEAQLRCWTSSIGG